MHQKIKKGFYEKGAKQTEQKTVIRAGLSNHWASYDDHIFL